MNEIFKRYKVLTREIYSKMVESKKQDWVFEFICESYDSAKGFFIKNDLDPQSDFLLRQKMQRLDVIKRVLAEIYNEAYKKINPAEFKEAVFLAQVYCEQIIEQTLELTFSDEMSPGERNEQLEGVIPNYYFTLFRIQEIKSHLYGIPLSYWT